LSTTKPSTAKALHFERSPSKPRGCKRPGVTFSQRMARIHRFLVPPDSGHGWTAYLWLAYLLFFFIEWYFRPVGTLELSVGLASIAVFLALYFSAFRRRGRAALGHILAIVALAIAWSWVNAGASVLFILPRPSPIRPGRRAGRPGS